MTPRQLSAMMQLRERRLLAERADLMRDIRLAQHGDNKTFNKVIKKMDDEGQ